MDAAALEATLETPARENPVIEALGEAAHMAAEEARRDHFGDFVRCGRAVADCFRMTRHSRAILMMRWAARQIPGSSWASYSPSRIQWIHGRKPSSAIT